MDIGTILQTLWKSSPFGFLIDFIESLEGPDLVSDEGAAILAKCKTISEIEKHLRERSEISESNFK